jgi:ATP-dependent protease ClpP protease subunit
MIHQPSGGASGMASDIAIHAEEILKTRAKYVIKQVLVGTKLVQKIIYICIVMYE